MFEYEESKLGVTAEDVQLVQISKFWSVSWERPIYNEKQAKVGRIELKCSFGIRVQLLMWEDVFGWMKR